MIVILAGAGMSAENTYQGQPIGDYRQIRDSSLSEGYTYRDLISPITMMKFPELFWKFYREHSTALLNAELHPGFEYLRKYIRSEKYVIITTNVDDSFARAGFDRSLIYEVHGSLAVRQCGCGIDESNREWFNTELKCETCGQMSRPNVLMFNDMGWKTGRSDQQWTRLRQIFRKCPRTEPITILEIGAGSEIPEIIKQGKKVR